VDETLDLPTPAAAHPPQGAGYRRPINWGPRFGAAFGRGLATLYAVTTISGPPLAVLLANEGYAEGEFRAALGFVRLAESVLTAAAYRCAGMFTVTSVALPVQICRASRSACRSAP
jgi:hypothetical protein